MKAHVPFAMALAAGVLLERRCSRILADARQVQGEAVAVLWKADGLLQDTRALVGEWQADETAAVNGEAGA